MAHALIANKLTGMIEHAYLESDGIGWHKLGQAVRDGATIEEWLTASGMTYSILRAAVQYATATGILTDAENHVLYRSDTGERLGIVSPDYHELQPRENVEFFRDLVTDAGYALTTCGVLFGGKKTWAQAKIGETMIKGADAVKAYLLLSTSADGTRCTEARTSSTRVVCNNTLNMAFGENSGKVIKVGHRTKFNAAAVRAEFVQARDTFENFSSTMRALADVQVTALDAADFIRRLLRPSDAAKDVAKAAKKMEALGVVDGSQTLADLLAKPATITGGETVLEKQDRAPKGEKAMFDLFAINAIGGTMEGAGGTLWGLLNAVTEHVDHHSTAKTLDHRFDNATFGKGDALKTRALNLACEMAGINGAQDAAVAA